MPQPTNRATRCGPRARVCGLLFPACLLLAWPLAAAEPPIKLRAVGVWLSPAGDEIRLGAAPEEAAAFALGDGSALGLELEYLWRPKLAVELFVFFGDLDAELAPVVGAAGTAAGGELGTETYTLGLNYLLATPGRGELWAGVFGGFSYYDDIALTTPASGQRETFRFDDDLGFGVKIGFDLPLARHGRWLASIGLRYQSSILEGEVAGRDLDVDPLIVTLGAGYRFQGGV